MRSAWRGSRRRISEHLLLDLVDVAIDARRRELVEVDDAVGDRMEHLGRSDRQAGGIGLEVTPNEG